MTAILITIIVILLWYCAALTKDNYVLERELIKLRKGKVGA